MLVRIGAKVVIIGMRNAKSVLFLSVPKEKFEIAHIGM